MVHQALQTSDLLDIIFSYADKSDNAVCALVCKRWLDPALNELWRCVDDPVILWSLLAPMHTTYSLSGSGLHWIFSRRLLPSDWSRFQFYAHRIRRFEHSQLRQRKLIDASVYAEVARTRPTHVILPKLTTFVWHPKLLNKALFLMYPTVTQLVVHIDDPPQAYKNFPEASAFFIDAASWLPNLTILHILASYSVRSVQASLLHLLASVLRLKKVTLPRYWLSSSVVSTLAGLPRLEVVHVGQGQGACDDVEAFNVILPDGAFPNLINLTLEVNLSDAEELIRSSSFPRHIAVFNILSLRLDSPSVVQCFLASCSTHCRSLTSLNLELINTLEDIPESSRITMETLEPLFAFPNLTQFTLTYNQPLSITDSDAHRLASRWPLLVTLRLNCEPVVLTKPDLTLAALLPFAEHCPNLEELGLYIDATALPPLLDPPLFKRLRSLRFGTSPISGAIEVALFLSRICPTLCIFSPTAATIEPLVSWYPAVFGDLTLYPGVWKEVAKRISVWQGVKALLATERLQESSKSKILEESKVEGQGVRQSNNMNS